MPVESHGDYANTAVACLPATNNCSRQRRVCVLADWYWWMGVPYWRSRRGAIHRSTTSRDRCAHHLAPRAQCYGRRSTFTLRQCPRASVSVTSYRLSRLTTEPLFHRRGKTTFQRKGVFVYLVLGDVRRRKLALMTSRFPSRLQHPVNAPITKKCFRKCDSTGERVCTESPSARKSGRLPP